MLHSTGLLGSYLARAALILSCNAALEFAISGASMAAPVSFQFQTNVASVMQNRGGAGLPFTVTVGDTVTATFTFDPENNGPEYPQLHPLEFSLNANPFNTPSYSIAVRNNDTSSVPANGRIADPANAPVDDDPGDSSDNIFLSCTESSTNCGMLEGHPELSFRPVIVFSNIDSLLQSSELTPDTEIWNSFSFREMALVFSNSITTGETYVGAFINGVTQVPEPRVSFQLVLVLGLLTARFRRVSSCGETRGID